MSGYLQRSHPEPSFVRIGNLFANASQAFLPRKFPTIDLRRLRDAYERAEPAFTQGFLVDTITDFVSEGSTTLQRKAIRLQLALGLLSVSVVLEGFAIIAGRSAP